MPKDDPHDFKKRVRQSLEWYGAEKTDQKYPEICSTADVFRGRLDRFYQDVLKWTKNESDISLLSAAAGEIGNNCFDHNLGHWRDVPGCWFAYGLFGQHIWAVIADRGQGVLASLKHVLPALETDQQALETAFHKRVSGRSPENRGNGLKFVRNVINAHKERGLFFISGNGRVIFGIVPDEASELVDGAAQKIGQGTFALLLWGNDA